MSEAATLTLVELFRQQLAASRLGAGQACLAITDTAWDPTYATACLEAARLLGAQASLVTLEADRPVRAASLAPCVHADLVVYMTAHTLHYRPEIGAALDAGARVLAVMQPAPPCSLRPGASASRPMRAPVS